LRSSTKPDSSNRLAASFQADGVISIAGSAARDRYSLRTLCSSREMLVLSFQFARFISTCVLEPATLAIASWSEEIVNAYPCP
jgi:hypothetical protein